jgi:hypothetical protein
MVGRYHSVQGGLIALPNRSDSAEIMSDPSMEHKFGGRARATRI